MKILKLSLYEIATLMDQFSKAALVGRAEHEDVELYRKFKYAAGKNYEHCRQICDRHAPVIKKIGEPPAKLQEYAAKRDQIAIQYANLLPNGELDAIENEETGTRTLKYTAANEAARIEAELALDAEYRDVLDAWESREQRRLDYMNLVEEAVAIHTFPWDKVPEQMAGGYMAAISCMLDGIPEEFTQNVVDSAEHSQQE